MIHDRYDGGRRMADLEKTKVKEGKEKTVKERKPKSKSIRRVCETIRRNGWEIEPWENISGVLQ